MMQMSRVAVSSRPMAPQRQALCSVPRPGVAMRFQDEKKSTDTKLSQQEIKAVENKEAGNISSKTAEQRADLGTAWKDPAELQAFDGPAPETINSRLSMLGVAIALVWEATTGLGVREQVADHPLSVVAVFVIIAIASYVPITKGYTRKEAFSNGIWTPQAENWNGRIAMMGFLGLILTEAISGTTVSHLYGLDRLFGSGAIPL